SILTFMLKELINVLLPFLTAMSSASMLEGSLPQSQRHAIVTSLLKKSSLDPGELKNYKCLSNHAKPCLILPTTEYSSQWCLANDTCSLLYSQAVSLV